MPPRADSKKPAAAPSGRKRVTPKPAAARKRPATKAAPKPPAADQAAAGSADIDRHTGDLNVLLADLRALAGEFRSQMDALRAEFEQARRELEESRRSCRAAIDDWKLLQTETASVRDRLETAGQAARKHADELAAPLRAARDESNALSRELGKVREQLASLTENARATPTKAVPAGPAAEVRLDPPESGGRNRLGVTVEPGLLVAEIRADGSAATAGLAAGDVIDGVNGLPVHTGLELRDAVRAVPPDAEVGFRVRRNGVAQDLKAHREPSTTEGDWLGLTVEAGVVVDEVFVGSPAAVAGLRPGDVITRVNDEPVVGGEQLRMVIQPLLPRTEVCLRVTHAGKSGDVILRLDDPAMGS